MQDQSKREALLLPALEIQRDAPPQRSRKGVGDRIINRRQCVVLITLGDPVANFTWLQSSISKWEDGKAFPGEKRMMGYLQV